MYSTLDIAKYVINHCLELGKPISNLQLQYILYYIQINSLKELKEEAFYDDMYEWRIGPVVPDIYFKFSTYAGLPILRRFNNTVIQNSELLKIINNTAEEKMNKPAWQLVKENRKSLKRIN